ncbi:metal ABC transporter solute-binding protein, Zn/Mn family [Vaginisenegalia massiliensis]|uniref:metal ABC transporter solute-binding protein, Zn/Mn family n=1 Tax=Vaginisenegalia massiliensis TaxID=2058294 RepID=UPI000F5402C9|nr:zinc ABC transporter substrate-binding protein [Vaginisenegalia massiliensis]
MTFKKFNIILLAVAFLTFGSFGHGLAKVQASDKKQVVTTFYPVYYLTQRIAGDKMDVTMLLEANQDAHDYETSAKDVARIQEADAFVYQSDEMEHFVADVTKSLDTNKTKVVMSTQGIDLLKGAGHDHAHEGEDHAHEGEDHAHEGEDHAHEGEDHAHEGEDHAHEGEDHAHEGEDHAHEGEDHAHEGEDHAHEEGEAGHHHEYDPHTWTDPMTYAKQAEVIKKALVEIDPDNAKSYEANTQKLVEDLTQLDKEYKEKLAKLDNKTIVVQHAAFGYMAHAYGLTQESITGISTTQEPSAATLAEMQKFVKDHKVKTIFVEPSLDQAIAKTVAQASGAELRPLRTLETLSQEEMAKGEDYLSVMRANLEQLTK